jgi:tetratricopeptide (TPR) repeat protein
LGNLRQLQSLQGSFVLLAFFATTAQSSLDQVSRLNRRLSELAASQLQVLAVNVDQAGDREAAQSFATRQASSLPILFATEEVAGIYNIVYRYLFDRRRDLGIPTSFLLDKGGMIVKVYQGQVDTQRLLEDVKSVPITRADRLRRATPFPGTLFQSTFERNDFTYGVALFQHGYLDQAAESFQQVVAAKPDDPDAYYNLGTLALRRNDFQAARQYLEQTLKLRPNYPEAWNNLGMMAAQQGRPDEAIGDFQQSLELRPKYAIALLNLGNVYRRQLDFPKAEECLRHALEIQPDDPEISYSLGMLYAQQDRMASAAEYLQRAVAQRPAYPEALNNLGVLYVREQDYQKAEVQFRIGIRVAPNYDQSYLNLARLCAMRGDKDKAREVLQELLRIQPTNVGAQQALERLE